MTIGERVNGDWWALTVLVKQKQNMVYWYKKKQTDLKTKEKESAICLKIGYFKVFKVNFTKNTNSTHFLVLVYCRNAKVLQNKSLFF